MADTQFSSKNTPRALWALWKSQTSSTKCKQPHVWDSQDLSQPRETWTRLALQMRSQNTAWLKCQFTATGPSVTKTDTNNAFHSFAIPISSWNFPRIPSLSHNPWQISGYCCTEWSAHCVLSQAFPRFFLALSHLHHSSYFARGVSVPFRSHWGQNFHFQKEASLTSTPVPCWHPPRPAAMLFLLRKVSPNCASLFFAVF